MLDVLLMVKRKTYLITDVLRTKPGMTFMAILMLHVVNLLGKADPFRAAAGGINKRWLRIELQDGVVVSTPVDALTLTDVSATIQ